MRLFDHQDAPQPAVPVPLQEPLAPSSLAQATPQEQKQLLSERLYHIIKRSHGDLASKITGMLLEIDNAELLHMLESPDSLSAKVEEAVIVLKAHQAKYVHDMTRHKVQRADTCVPSTQGIPADVPQPAVPVPLQEPLTPYSLAQATPQQQKQMLGERLYHIIQPSLGDSAGKFTGMLLEIDNAELLHLLDFCDSLNAKILEGTIVLVAHQAKNPLKQKQMQMLGESLYHIIEPSYSELAGNITGMLLELDNSELLDMLESCDTLNAKVEEARIVWKVYQTKKYGGNSSVVAVAC
ncbi:uncharacterized protein LOC117122709 [Anneissia japonica]|uniref:uncharacterized protein LOC117122709 n=1 Tax=Anneissia japonica TaxID=1529436 RepID=UPI0014255A11|nr:uncharacterized protein LOC117122709 [Anneissia japonica]